MTALAGILADPAGRDLRTDCDRMLQSQAIYGKEPRTWHGENISLGRSIFRTLPEDRYDLGPVIGGDDNLVLVADIRLDNRHDLYRALNREPAEFRQFSDSMVAMRCIEAWGDAAIERFVGDFAIALWKRRERELLLARDFLGHRPLHFHRGDGFLAFASMPKGLHSLSDVPRELDELEMADFLALLPRAGTSTFFKGIERVEPGSILVIGKDKTRTVSYWNPQPEKLDQGSAEDWADAMAECLSTAVEARLRVGTGGIGSHLSAGLDSSAVTATAARLLGSQPLVAFTAVPPTDFDGWVPPGRFADEGPLAGRTAALYPNIQHVRIGSEGQSLLDGLDRHAFLYERPGLNLCNDAWADAIKDEARRRKLSVMLIGQMGNATISFSGHQHISDLLAHGRLVAVARAMAQMVKQGSSVKAAAAAAFGPFTPRWMWQLANRLARRGSGLSSHSAINRAAPFMAALEKRAADRKLDFAYRPRRNATEARLWMLRRADMGNYLKGVSGGWGIDMRDPTSDRRLVELCLSIPTRHYLEGGRPRSLARLAFSGSLPKEVLVETRSGYQAADWFQNLSRERSHLREELTSLANMPAVQSMIDVDMLEALERNWPDRAPTSIAGVDQYRTALLRGLAAGHFVRRIAGGNQ